MGSLAAKAAARAQAAPADAPAPVYEYTAQADAVAVLEPDDLDTELDDTEPDDVPVHVAWRRVMREVRAIAKTRQVAPDKDGKGPRYKFRGVEDVVKAFSGSIRRHGIIIGPQKVEPTYSTAGTRSRDCTVIVTWFVMGPRGDFWPCQIQTAGEAMDYQDKATTKAQSIALRTLMTTLGFVPTEDPEPELESAQMERGDPTPTAASYADEISNPYTPRERFRQIHNEIRQHRLVGAPVEHQGERMALGQMLDRVGLERWPKVPAHTNHPVGEWAEGCAGCQAMSDAIDRQA